MYYLQAPCIHPLLLVGAGYLENPGGFLHAQRVVEEEFVLILCIKGTLYIEQDNARHEIKPHEYFLLRPGVMHRGYQPSEGPLAYYWCHFTLWGNAYQLLNKEEITRQLTTIKDNPETPHDFYLLPETGSLKHSERVILQFRQLLDAARQPFYSGYLVHYALSLLGLEITTQFVLNYDTQAHSATYKQIVKIIDWIRTHYTEPLSVTRVAQVFSYHPGYIASVFKKHTGTSLLDFINKTKIDAAKNLLLSTNETVKNIAGKLGFTDDKYFMKVFNRLEGTTPRKFRNAFFRQFSNTE